MNYKIIKNLEDSELFRAACDFIDSAVDSKALMLFSDHMIKQRFDKKPKWYKGCGFYENKDDEFSLRYKTIEDVKFGDAVNGHEFTLELSK